MTQVDLGLNECIDRLVNRDGQVRPRGDDPLQIGVKRCPAGTVRGIQNAAPVQRGTLGNSRNRKCQRPLRRIR
jgi:hypothetical protein